MSTIGVNANRQAVLSVANTAALTALPDHRFGERARAKPVTLDQPFELKKTSTATVDGITVVATKSGTGRWVRVLERSPRWTAQSNWFVRHTGGSDENDGATAETAIASLAEWCRRLKEMAGPAPGLGFSGNSRYVIDTDNVPITDVFRPSGSVDATFSGDNVYEITIRGTRTAFFTGTVGAGGVVTTTGNVQSSFDGGSGFVPASNIGKMIEITSGAAVGSFAWVTKDLGGASAQISDFYKAIPGTDLAALAAPLPSVGDSYQTVDLTSFAAPFNALGANAHRFRWIDLDFTPTVGLDLFQPRNISNTFNTCKIQRVVSPTFGGAMLFLGCGVFFSSLTSYPLYGPGTIGFVGCGCRNVAVEVCLDSPTILSDCHVEAGVVRTFATVNVRGFGGVAAAAATTSGGISVTGTKGLGVFGSATSGVVLRNKGFVQVSAPLYGSGNTVAGVDIAEGSVMTIKSTVTPTITGAADLVIDAGAPIPIVSAVDGTVSAGSAVTTWSAYTGASYSGSLMNLRNGTSLLRYT